MEYFDFFGFYYGENEIDVLLKEFSIKRAPVLPRDDSTVNLVSGKKGVEVVFADPDTVDFQGRDYPDGAPVLVCIFFYGKNVDGFSAFQGELPYGIKFEHKKNDLINLLGEPLPDISNEKRLSWSRKNHRLHVVFNDSGEIRRVHIAVPQRKF